MLRPLEIPMRIPFVLPVVLLSLCLSAPALRAGDDDPASGAPVAPPAPPQPPVLVQEDALDQLIRGLLADAAPERTKAEAVLARADADSLRALVGRLRQRLGARPPAPTPPAAHEPAPRAPAAREPGGPMVLLETRIVEAPAAVAKELVGLGAPRADGTRCYDRAALETLLGALGKGSKTKVLSAPSIVTAVGERADLSILDQTAFVESFELVRSPGTFMADPIIGTVQVGVRLELTPSLLGEELSVRVGLDLSALAQPIAQWTGPLVKGLPEVTFQLPEVTTTRWTRRVVAPQGRPVLLAALPSPSGGETRVLVFLEATLVTPAQDAVAPPAAGK
jgi:hypothetical protein